MLIIFRNFSTEISNRSYFATQINIIDCYVSFQCKSRTWNLDKNTNCSLQYTTNSAYNKLSNPIVAMSGSSVRFLHLVETTQSYFFEFSVTVKEGFVIKERIEKVFPQSEWRKILIVILMRYNLIINMLIVCFFRHTFPRN